MPHITTRRSQGPKAQLRWLLRRPASVPARKPLLCLRRKLSWLRSVHHRAAFGLERTKEHELLQVLEAEFRPIHFIYAFRDLQDN